MRVFRGNEPPVPPPVPPVKPTGRKLVKMLGFGRNAEEQGFSSYGCVAPAGPFEMPGILRQKEQKCIALLYAFFPVTLIQEFVVRSAGDSKFAC